MVGLGRSRQRMVFSKKRSHSRRYSPLKPGSSGVFFWSRHLLRAAEIVAGREMLAGAGQDDHPHVAVVDRCD